MDQVLALAAQIVSSHVSHNQMTPDAIVGFTSNMISVLRKAQETSSLNVSPDINPPPSSNDQLRFDNEDVAVEDQPAEVQPTKRPVGRPRREPAPVWQPEQNGELRPFVEPENSVFKDFIICLEDGKKMKMLKRHLSTSFNMTPEQYRERWKLPHNYPMVCPNYAEKRSTLAKSSGLGRTSKSKDGRKSSLMATVDAAINNH